jgi:hypothetical protein
MATRPLASVRALVLALFVALGGCASTPPPDPDPVDPAAIPPVVSAPVDPDPYPPASVNTGPTMGQRAQSAAEGMLMGAVVGSAFGPFGAAAGAGVMLVYSAITGQVPFQSSGGGGGYGGGYGYPGSGDEEREAELEDELEREVARGDALEDEIDAELKRQEELLQQIEQQEKVSDTAAAAIPASISDENLATRADPRIAPKAPSDRELPAAIFDESRATIPKGQWGNPREMTVVKRSLDADRDGKPEEVRFFDAKGGLIIRKEQDQDYDGVIDTFTTYEGGVLVARQLDRDNNRKLDTWETYAAGTMTARAVDRDGDGVKDAFYTFSGDSLTEERHDANNDGKPDLAVFYAQRKRTRSEEDRDRDATAGWTPGPPIRSSAARRSSRASSATPRDAGSPTSSRPSPPRGASPSSPSAKKT